MKDSEKVRPEVHPSRMTRRNLIKLGLAGGAGVLASASLASAPGLVFAHDRGLAAPSTGSDPHLPRTHAGYPGGKPGGLDPARFLRHFDWGQESRLPDGTTRREYRMVAGETVAEVAPGLEMPVWLYNQSLPGPTLRCREGDLVRVEFLNASTHNHTIHFHGIHAANMDGVFEQIPPGGTFTYEFTARPFGVHLYHCHVMPIDKHIAKGMFGMWIVDPRDGWEPVDHEMVMVMHGLDVDGDAENELYAVNGVAFYYRDYPIPLRVGETVRLFCGNMTEFDPINSFHLHGEVFRYYPTGTRRDQYFITDTIMQCQGERGIFEFSFQYPGMYMFHAHQSEFTQLGWVGFFDVKE